MPDFEIDSYINRFAESKSIDYNNGTITQVRVKVTVAETDYTPNFILYLSANGGVSWEVVKDGFSTTFTQTYIFTNTGTDLRWKLVGTGRISEIIIDSYH